LLLCDRHIVLHVAEDGRRHEVPFVATPPAADQELGPLFFPLLAIAENALHLLFADERCQPGLRVERVADNHLCRTSGEDLHELIARRLLDQDTAAGGTHLTLVEEDSAEG